jgi:hypothetical protein
MEVSWQDFKSAALQFKEGAIRSLSVDGLRYVYLSEGPVELFCKVTEQADQVEFLSLFAARSNISIASKNSILASSEGMSFVSLSTPWVENAHDDASTSLPLTEPTYFLGGTIIVSGALPGDNMTFEVVHPQAGVVGVYLKNFLLPEGNSQTTIREAAKLLPAGLILKAIYNSVSSQGSSAGWGVNFTAYKSEARKT